MGIIEDPNVVLWFAGEGEDNEKPVLKLSVENVDIVVIVEVVPGEALAGQHMGGDKKSGNAFMDWSLLVGDPTFTDNSFVFEGSLSVRISDLLA